MKPLTDQQTPRLFRRVVIGGLLGAVVGLVVGFLLHVAVTDSPAAGYELVGAFVGLVAGALLGAFYGGYFAIHRAQR